MTTIFDLRHVVRGPDAYLVPKSDGRLLVGATSEERGFQTDGRVPPTGFPFKVLTLPATLAEPEQYNRRSRMCDLGYLRMPYVDSKGHLLGRCPAELRDDYERKGGTSRRREIDRVTATPSWPTSASRSLGMERPSSPSTRVAMP